MKIVSLILVLAVTFFAVFLFSRNFKNRPSENLSPSATPTEAERACRALTVLSPLPNEKISSPLAVEATVNNTNPNCRWTVFEAQAGTMQLIDSTGKKLGSGVLKTNEDWTASKPVKYTGQIVFTNPKDSDLKLIFTEENPSGRENPQTYSLPIKY